MPCLLTSLRSVIPEMQEQLSVLERAETLDSLVGTATEVGQGIARCLVEAVLAGRAAAPTTWGRCEVCGTGLQSKGRRPRQMKTGIGVVGWRRRVGRCPQGCAVGEVAPLDRALGVAVSQRTSGELSGLACLLAVFVPFESASRVLQRARGIGLSPSAIWSSVQTAGRRAHAQQIEQMAALEAGGTPAREVIAAKLQELALVIGADGVMVPFRPNGGSPKGATVWREAKIGILARIGQRLNRHGRQVTHLAARRLVAVLGSIDELVVRLRLEALRQNAWQAKQLAWTNDRFDALFQPAAAPSPNS